jgi:hypothetical protein
VERRLECLGSFCVRPVPSARVMGAKDHTWSPRRQHQLCRRLADGRALLHYSTQCSHGGRSSDWRVFPLPWILLHHPTCLGRCQAVSQGKVQTKRREPAGSQNEDNEEGNSGAQELFPGYEKRMQREKLFIIRLGAKWQNSMVNPWTALARCH